MKKAVVFVGVFIVVASLVLGTAIWLTRGTEIVTWLTTQNSSEAEPPFPTPTATITAQPVPTISPTATLTRNDSRTPTAIPTPTPTPPPVRFVETFDGAPSSPQPWPNSDTWTVNVHSRDVDTWFNLDVATGTYGSLCADFANTHEITAYEDVVYQCDDHVMTALSAESYGVVYLSPNHMVDFSTQEAVIQFDLSTGRQSVRDWVDIWISPFSDQLVYPLEPWLPDLTGEPRNAIHIRLDSNENARWYAEVIRAFTSSRLNGTEEGWQGYQMLLEPSFEERTTYELRISETHIKFGLPDLDFWWIDEEIAPLGWSEGVVQFGHHSYNPNVECQSQAACGNTTWHWDNISIQPALPFTIIPAEQRFVGVDSAEPNNEDPQTVTFAQPAPSNAFVRFAGIGNDLEISFDEGATWQTPPIQEQLQLADEKFKSFWMPVPEGQTAIQLRGKSWWGGPWHFRDIAIWSLEVDGKNP